MKANKLMNFLIDLENQGYNLKDIEVNYRQDYDSDIESIEIVEEDLFDEKTNSVLKSIVLVGNAWNL